MPTLRHAFATAAAAITVVTGAAQAAAPACGTAQLIVPWGAGGDTDIVFRQIVDVMNKDGQQPQLQVVNMGGQGGNKGAKVAVKANPDGCTLFAIHQSAITSYFTGRVDFTWDAFDTIAMMTRTASFVGAAKDTPYNNLKEMVAYAKQHPDTVTAGSTFGSTSQFIYLLIEELGGIKLKHVSYDDTKQRMTALLAGNINSGEINLAAAKKYIQSGDIKTLAVMGGTRLTELDSVPTAIEQGINFTFGVDRGIVAPKGTPKEVINAYAKRLEAVAKDPDLMASMKAKGTEMVFKGPQAYAEQFASDFTNWKALAKKVGVYKRND